MTIDISPEERAAYEEIASEEGLSVEQWLKRLADARMRDARRTPCDVQSKSLLEIFEPLRGLELEFPRSPSTGRPVDL